MKKLISLLLCAALALTFCACGDSKTETPDPAPAPTEESAPRAKDIIAQKAEEKANAAFERGVVSDGRYESKSLGLGWKYDDNWILANEDEIAQIMGLTADLLTDEALAETVKNGSTVCDLYAQSSDYRTLNIQVQTFDSFFERTMVSLASDAELVDEIYKQFTENDYANVIYESLGLTGGSMEKSTTTFVTENRPCIRIDGVIQSEGFDIPLHEIIVFSVNGQYMATITAASYMDASADSALAGFYKLP